MHPTPAFRQTPAADVLEFMRQRSFGALVLNADPVPLISHIPFVIGSDGAYADLHLVRSNPIARQYKSRTPAKIAVSGPDSYISPDWYEIEDQVPTWNYIAAHLTGSLEPLPIEDLDRVLADISHHFESRLAPKPEWTYGKMTPEVFEKMKRAILPFRFHIDRIDGTWKLGQNKPNEVRKNAAHKVAEHGIGSEIEVLGQLMHDANT